MSEGGPGNRRRRRAKGFRCSHDPVVGQVAPTSLVILLGRDDGGTGTLDGRWWIRDDDVEAFIRQFEVVSPIRDDDSAIGVGQDRRRVGVVKAEHVQARLARVQRRPSGVRR